MPAMHALSRRQLLLLALLTVTWGLSWPAMKVGASGYPPLTFRAISIWLGLPVLALALKFMRVPLRIPRRHWPELLVLATFNMFIWHACIMLAVRHLSSGRTAILGYTMPIFSALIGALVFGAPLSARTWTGVGAAACGVVLLLWHELTGLAGSPGYVGVVLVGAAAWALGTQLLRRTRLDVPTLAITFWMIALTAVVLTALSLAFEPWPWPAPGPAVQWAIAYNALVVFCFAQAAWFQLARALPPLASTLSVMLIPVVGVFSGAWLLGEVLHWQDWAAVGLMVVAIASVLLPRRAPA